MTKSNIDNKKVYNYLKNEVIPNKETLSNRELVLAVLALGHLENLNNLTLGLNTTVMSASALAGIMASVSVTGLLGLLVTGTIGTVGAICGDLKRKQIRLMQEEVTDCLSRRYSSFKETYDAVAKMIVSVDREEILQYLEMASK